MVAVGALWLAGCMPMMARLDGVSGPVAWRAADLKQEERAIGGELAGRYSFTLTLKETTGRRITFNRFESVIGDIHTNPGFSTREVTWVLPAHGELKLPLSSATSCSRPPCGYNPSSAPRWAITLTGTDSDGRAVRVPIDIQLPADPGAITSAAKPTAAASSAATGPRPTVSAPSAPPSGTVTPPPVVERPSLVVGTRWYRSDGVLEVLERGQDRYVLRLGRDRRLELTADGAVREIATSQGDPLVRFDPPYPLLGWPLAIGNSWGYRGTRRDVRQQRTTPLEDLFRVEAYEPVAVGGGTASAFRIQSRYARYWYSPDAATIVKYLPIGTEPVLGAFELTRLTPGVEEGPASATERRPTPGPGSTATIPVQIVETLILVPVTLNERHGATLLLDTGAQLTVLTPETGRRLGVTPPAAAPRRSLTVLGGQTVDIPLVRLRSIELGSLRIENLEVGVFPVAPNAPMVDGVLGSDVLARYRVTVDHDARHVRLAPRR